MKKLFGWLLMLAVCAVASAQTPPVTPPIPRVSNGNLAGLLYASNFGQWEIPSGNLGAYSWNAASYCYANTVSVTFHAFTVGTPITIVDTGNPSATEIVTPSQVTITPPTGNNLGSCAIVVTPVNPHTNFYFASATAGLQETLNWAGTNPYEIVLTPDWTLLGGTTAMITAAQGNANVSILDQRTASLVVYVWNGSQYVSSGGLLPSGCVVVANGRIACDLERNAAHWFDMRSYGAVCNGKYLGTGSSPWTSGTNDTAAFFAALVTPGTSGLAPIGGSMAEIPAAPYQAGNGAGASGTDSLCLVTPGQLIIPTLSQIYTIEGRGKLVSTIYDSTNSGTQVTAPGPLMQIGDNNANLQQTTELRAFALSGAPYDVFPNGVLNFFSDNISTIRDVSVFIGSNAPGSVGINTRQSTYQGEMKFENVAVFGQGNANYEKTIGMQLGSTGGGGNYDIVDTNIEDVFTAVDCNALGGNANLVHVSGGHFERINAYGAMAFNMHPCGLIVDGLDLRSGEIYLDSSSCCGSITLLPSAPDYPAVFVDNSVGNKFTQAVISPYSGATLRLNGDEQYKTPSAYLDTQFETFSGTEWATTNSSNITVSSYPTTAPAATTGQAIKVSSTGTWTSADNVSTTFAVAPSTDYEVVAVLPVTHSYDQAPTITVYDNYSSAIIAGPYTITPTGGAISPTNVDAGEYAVERFWVPASANATTWTVKLNTSAASQTFYVQYLGVNPSATVMASPVITGSGVCTGSGAVGAYCSIPGEDNGATPNTMKWVATVPGIPGGAFVRFHMQTSSSAVAPNCSLGGGTPIYFQASENRDFNIPLGYFPSQITCQDSSAPSSVTQNMVMSQISIVSNASTASGVFNTALTVAAPLPSDLGAVSQFNANRYISATALSPGMSWYGSVNKGYELGVMPFLSGGQDATLIYGSDLSSVNLSFYPHAVDQNDLTGMSTGFQFSNTQASFSRKLVFNTASGVCIQFSASAQCIGSWASSASGATAGVNAPPTGGTGATVPTGAGAWSSFNAVSTGTQVAGQVACIKAVATSSTPAVIGTCSGTVNATNGACGTCN